MKYFLIFTLLFSSAQAQDTVYLKPSDTTYLLRMPSKQYLDSLLNVGHKNDTLLVMILVTDKSATRKDGIMPAYATLAYSVRKWDAGNQIVNNTNPYRPAGWVHLKYLDILKRPLGENIVVWGVK